MKLITLVKWSCLVLLTLGAWYPNQVFGEGPTTQHIDLGPRRETSSSDFLKDMSSNPKAKMSSEDITETKDKDKANPSKASSQNEQEQAIVANLFNEQATYENFESQNNTEVNVVKIVPKQYLEP